MPKRDLIVRVMKNSTGQPDRNKQVTLNPHLFMPLWKQKADTDSDGIARFSVRRIGFNGRIAIDGVTVYIGNICASNTIYI